PNVTAIIYIYIYKTLIKKIGEQDRIIALA
ncbi:MAG: hypothetical protein ACI91R_000427, partial [Vicingaceae bacterium]